MEAKRPLRRSFILVLWAESGARPDSQLVWRASLEDSQTARRYGFKSIADLARFLERQTAIDSTDSHSDP